MPDVTDPFTEWLSALKTPAAELYGFGARRAAKLAERYGPEVCLRDLVLAPPRHRRVLALKELAELGDGEGAVVDFTPAEPKIVRAGSRRRLWRLRGEVAGETLDLLWFKAPPASLARRFEAGGSYFLAGVVRRDRGWSMSHPKWIDPSRLGAVTVTYPGLTEALSRLVQAAIGNWIAAAPDKADWRASGDLARDRWPALVEALALIHALLPAAPDALDRARRRLAADEWLALQLGLEEERTALKRETAPMLQPLGRLAAAMERRLPFALSPSQRRTVGEIRGDLAAGGRMVRLVAGDVGSGKTVVAAMALADCIEAGRAGALMAPSDVLARQHADTLDRWLRPLGVEIALLTGNMKQPARRALRSELEQGNVHLVVGTHALLEGSNPLPDLGLVVIDEQHRFGVQQRWRLGDRGEAAHVLMLTATPIPRSLGLALLGDLSVSRLESRADAKRQVVTRLVPRRRLDDVIERLRAAVASGSRAFWVCPTVDADRERGVEARAAVLNAACPGLVAAVTGRMDATERAAALSGFAAGDRPILVATTVVEVGIDVPDARIMVIEAAERFGLSQLHQLRGRVGRDGEPSSCLLLFDEPLSERQAERLGLLRETDDGAVLAESDLAMRGPGDWLGLRQSGEIKLHFADMPGDIDLLVRMRETAATWAADAGPDPRLLFDRASSKGLQPTRTGLAAG